ncbi:hypothetical protein [Thioalkalivibrio sp. ALE19]|uniref:hypothetical protein n=1 Tax=Thioalkalivibrio sp. ALE19 TaxID=1266909 RepID=UPI000426A7D5|nr:hypothetical protein [Thioalkalivibrio sp. ALE19]
MADPDLIQVRAALDAGDFARARELINDLTLPPSSELLELRAMAAYGDGDLEGTLVADAPDNPVRAWIAAVRTYERLMCGDMPGTGHWARKAMERGHRPGLKAPAIIGQVAHARARIHDGAVDEGLSALDDVAVELTAGALGPVGFTPCWAFFARNVV